MADHVATTKKVQQLSNKRKAELFDDMCSKLIGLMETELLIGFLRGNDSLEELTETISSHVDDYFFYSLFSGMENDGNELDLVFQKHLPGLMEQDLQVQKVTIKW